LAEKNIALATLPSPALHFLSDSTLIFFGILFLLSLRHSDASASFWEVGQPADMSN
jgi:hypothetical protein